MNWIHVSRVVYFFSLIREGWGGEEEEREEWKERMFMHNAFTPLQKPPAWRENRIPQGR